MGRPELRKGTAGTNDGDRTRRQSIAFSKHERRLGQNRLTMNESELLPRKKCQEVFLAVEQAARRAGVKDVEAILTSTSDALTRFANNEIHQNVAERASGLSVRVAIDGRTAR